MFKLKLLIQTQINLWGENPANSFTGDVSDFGMHCDLVNISLGFHRIAECVTETTPSIAPPVDCHPSGGGGFPQNISALRAVSILSSGGNSVLQRECFMFLTFGRS